MHGSRSHADLGIIATLILAVSILSVLSLLSGLFGRQIEVWSALGAAAWLLTIVTLPLVFALKSNVRHEVHEYNVAIEILRSIGTIPMAPEMFKLLKAHLERAVRDFRWVRNITRVLESCRGATLTGAVLAVLAAAALAYVKRDEAPNFSWLQFAGALPPMILWLCCRGTVPQQAVTSVAQLAGIICTAFERLADPDMATKNSLVSLVTKGVDGVSEIVKKKIACLAKSACDAEKPKKDKVDAD